LYIFTGAAAKML